MTKNLVQMRAAAALLNPEEVRRRSTRPLHVGLVAENAAGYARLERALGIPEDDGQFAHRAGEQGAPAKVDLVLYDSRLAAPEGAYTFDADNPGATVNRIRRDHDDVELPLARQFPALRKPVVDRIIQAIAGENALFAITTALPDMVPNLLELPWTLGEWASDTAFLTVNQVRMAFLIGAACDREIGFYPQKFELLSIAGGAFGWRAIARELAGKIPFGAGLIPKGAIAYAGTYMVGKALEHLYHGQAWTAADRESAYQNGLAEGRRRLAGAGPKIADRPISL